MLNIRIHENIFQIVYINLIRGKRIRFSSFILTLNEKLDIRLSCLYTIHIFNFCIEATVFFMTLFILFLLLGMLLFKLARISPSPGRRLWLYTTTGFTPILHKFVRHHFHS